MLRRAQIGHAQPAAQNFAGGRNEAGSFRGQRGKGKRWRRRIQGQGVHVVLNDEHVVPAADFHNVLAAGFGHARERGIAAGGHEIHGLHAPGTAGVLQRVGQHAARIGAHGRKRQTQPPGEFAQQRIAQVFHGYPVAGRTQGGEYGHERVLRACAHQKIAARGWHAVAPRPERACFAVSIHARRAMVALKLRKFSVAQAAQKVAERLVQRRIQRLERRNEAEIPARLRAGISVGRRGGLGVRPLRGRRQRRRRRHDVHIRACGTHKRSPPRHAGHESSARRFGIAVGGGSRGDFKLCGKGPLRGQSVAGLEQPFADGFFQGRSHALIAAGRVGLVVERAQSAHFFFLHPVLPVAPDGVTALKCRNVFCMCDNINCHCIAAFSGKRQVGSVVPDLPKGGKAQLFPR